MKKNNMNSHSNLAKFRWDDNTILMSATTTGTDYASFISAEGAILYTYPMGSYNVEVETNKKGISPILYFKYIKKKFKILERMRMDTRLKRLEKAFYEALDSGQAELGEKLFKKLAVETRETAMYAKGIRFFIEKQDLDKHKRNIRGGHISNTMLKDFTRLIPKNVSEKYKNSLGLFDDYVVYHYWNEEEVKKVEKKQKMEPEERAKMRDPVLFGIIRETDKLYFIADWEDEQCDLTFDEIIDKVGLDDNDVELKREPSLIN